jgi:hypothetical protein
MRLLGLLGLKSFLVFLAIYGVRVDIVIYGAIAVIGANVTSVALTHTCVGLQRRGDRAEM